MYKSRNYNIIFFLSIFFLGVLVFENYRLGKVIGEKQKKLFIVNPKVQSEKIMNKKSGYGEIIKTLSNKEGLKIKKFLYHKDTNSAEVDIQIFGDIKLIEKNLKELEKSNNFRAVNNIKLQKDESGKSISIINMSFIKNR